MKAFLHFVKRKETLVAVYGAIALLGIRFLSDPFEIPWKPLQQFIAEGHSVRFNTRIWWSIVSVGFYLLIPLGYLLVTRQKLKDTGLSWRPGKGDLIYLYLFLAMVPLLILVSFSPAFQQKYPFYFPPETEGFWPWFVTWELFYCLQFLGLEYFFRGMLLHSFVPSAGNNAVLLALIPYVMIHFSKPPAEAFASILAGLALGYLSFRKKSVIPGALLHYAIALTMDLLALYQRGRL